MYFSFVTFQVYDILGQIDLFSPTDMSHIIKFQVWDMPGQIDFFWQGFFKWVFRICLPELIFLIHFLGLVVEVMTSRPPCVLKQWLGVSKDMLPVK